MTRLLRACHRAYAGGDSLALVAIVVVAALFVHIDSGVATLSGFSVRPGEHLLNYWLLLVLGASYAVWTVLRVRSGLNPAGAPGFVLSAFGLAARFYCHFLLYGLGWPYGDHSIVEDVATRHLRFMIAVHRYGGLLAFATGLAIVVWGSRRPPTLRGDRAARERSGSCRSAGRT